MGLDERLAQLQDELLLEASAGESGGGVFGTWMDTSRAIERLQSLAVEYRIPSAPPAAVAALLVLLVGWLLLQLGRAIFGAARTRSTDRYAPGTFRRRQLDALRASSGHFPGPFPNGWYHVCDASELAGGAVVSVSAFGREMVAFRGEDGRAGVLHAFCPHLGTHMGHGGTVQGNWLVCPYHEWSFDANGCNQYIPYLRQGPVGPGPRGHVGTARVNARAYAVTEAAGHVFVWYDADGRPPAYELSICRDFEGRLPEPRSSVPSRCASQLLRPFAAFAAWLGGWPPLSCLRGGCCGGWKIIGRDYRVGKYDGCMLMHVMEPSQNSADWYHFLTVHQWLGGMPPFLPLKLKHEISATYGAALADDADGEKEESFKNGKEVQSDAATDAAAVRRDEGKAAASSVPQVVRHRVTKKPKSATSRAAGSAAATQKEEEPEPEPEPESAQPPTPAKTPLPCYDGSYARGSGNGRLAGGGSRLPAHVLLINEDVRGLALWGCIPLPGFLAAMFSTQVELQGPANVLFRINFPLVRALAPSLTLPFC